MIRHERPGLLAGYLGDARACLAMEAIHAGQPSARIADRA
jgi:hypothetical protein